MKAIISFSERSWLRWGSLLVLLYLFIRYVSNIFTSFSEVYVDPDQLLLMFATEEFMAGRFHMPRFFGQDYGSMLEAIVAIPFTSLGLGTALPLATCILWLLPYAFVVHFFAKGNTKAWLFGLVWVMLLPVEYAFLGTMPRDFVTGIAITSLALPFFHRDEKWALLLFGFFCLIGWSINQNAALFGASITIFRILSSHKAWFRQALFISLGYALGMLVHLIIYLIIANHPEWIVHQAWTSSFDIALFFKAFTRLDTHWGAISPLGYKMSWTIVVCFIGFIVWSIVQKKKAVLWTTLTLLIMTFISFGLPKIHDGFDSIFSPFERMFLALPVSLFFIFISTNLHKRIWVVIFLVVGIGFYWQRIHSIEERTTIQLSQDKGHILPYAKTGEVFNRLHFIDQISDSLNTDLVITGPGAYYLDVLAQVAHVGLRPELSIVNPEFDRKTWLLREVDQPQFQRYLWLQSAMDSAELSMKTGKVVTDVKFKNDPFRQSGYYFLIEGEAMNPLDLYEKAGYSVCDH